MKENESSKWLYNELVSNGYNVGKDYEEFDSLMTNNEESRKWAYDTARELGYNVGKDYEEFNTLVNPVVSGQPVSIETKRNTYSPYSVAPADYTQKTEAQKNFEERGVFEPKGQGTVNLNGQEVPAFIGDEGQFRVPSPVKLDEQQEIFRHGNPSEAEQREEQERSYRNFVQSNRAKMDETDKRLSERMGEMTKQYFNDYKGVLQSDAMGEPAYMTALKGNRDYQNLRAAHNLIEDARKREKQVRRADEGFLTNTFRSMGETAIDERTWDLGARDMTDAISIYNAVQKDEKGEELSDSERILLDAFEGNALVMAQNKHRGESGGELAGAMTVEMIPFIAQIVANPLAKLGEATSKGAAKAISNWLYKRTKDMANKTARKAVRSAARGAVKFGAGLPADLAGGMGVAVTSNVMNTTADVYDRMLKGDSAGEAIAKGIISQGIEFASENAGRFFEPFFGGLGKVLGKGAEYGLNKVGAGSVVNLAKDYAKKAYTPAVKEFMDKTQWSGFLGEYGEELVGGVENALLVGDQTVSEVFSKDNLFDTAVGLSVASVLFPAIGTVNYGVEKGRQRKAVKEAEKIASGILKDRWPQFKAAINGAKNSDELGKAIEEIYKKEGKEYSDNKETQALFDYARSYYAYNALKGVDPNNVAYESELISAVRDNYQAGATMTAEELDNTRMDVNRIGVDLMRLTGMTEDELNDMDTAAVTQRINEAEENGDMDIADKWREFMNGSAAMSGKIKAVDDAINEQSAASDAEVDAITDGDGMIVLGTTRGGEQVYIIGGNVVLNGDNSINKEGSSAQLTVVRDGKRTTMGIVELESVDAPIDAAGEKVSRRTAIEENLRRQLRIDMGEEHVFTPGEKFETLQGEVQFVADRGDGTADITVNGNATVVDMGTLNEQFNTAKQMEYNARKAEETSQAQTVQAEVPQPVNDEQVTSEVAQSALQRVPKDEQGEPVYEQVDSDTAWDAIVEQTEGDEAMAQTVADGMVADKEAALKKLEKAKAKGGSTIAEKIAAEKERMAAIEAAKAELAKWKEIAGVAASRKAAPDINDASETETVATEGTKPTESVEVSAVEDVQPTNEMQSVEVETEHIGESTEMVGTVPSEAENGNENGNENLRPITAPAEVTDVETADEFVAGLLGGIKITPESFRKETGLGINEQRKLVGIIAGEEKGGVSVERASEIIAENYAEELAASGFNGDEQDIRNMLIDILSSGNPRSYVKQSKERRAAEWVEQETARADAWASENFGFASYDDLIAYEETLIPNMIQKYAGFDEQTYFNTLAENYEYDTTRESERVGNGSEVLQGERAVPSPRTENTGERNEGGAVQDDVQGGAENADVQEQEEVGHVEDTKLSLTISQDSEQVSDQDVLIKGGKWEKAKEPEKFKSRTKKHADSHDVVWYIGKKRYGSTTAERDLLRVLADEYSSLNAIWNAYENGEIILSENEAAILKKLIETNSTKAELQQGSLPLDTDNPAFEAATKNTIDAVKKAGVEVVEATPEMVQAVLGGMQAEMQAVQDANERFNKELDAFRDKQHKGLLHLGRPMGILSAAGVNARELTMSPTVLHQHLKKHNLTTDDLRGLAEAVQSPILVYRHGETRPNLVIVTELNVNGGKLAVALRLDANGNVVEVSNVSSVHSKDGVKELERLSLLDESKLRDYLRWVEKEKVSDWLGLPYEEERQDANPKLVSVANVINNFENPKIETGFSRATSPFYSNAKKAVLDIKQEKATPQQWVAMLKKNGGLKAGEDAWVGLEAWLNEQSGSVTKQQILDYIDENAIQIEEVQYSQFGYGMMDEAANNLEAETKAIGWDAMKEKYPGIEEYFEYDNGEILWSEARASVGEYEDFILDNRIVDVNPSDEAINETREKYTTEGLKRKREIALVVPTIESWNESDEVHFGDAGNGRAVAWVRFGETTDSEGNRVLVIDEIQSKRHQDGRENGYGGATSEDVKSALEAVNAAQSEFDEYNAEMAKKYGSEYDWNIDATDAEIDKWQELYDKVAQLGQVYEDVAESNRKGIPSAPFEKNWHELAMKRMLRYAAENGFDKVAWTTGKQQAERYNLSRDVDLIQSVDNNMEVFSDGTPVAKDVRVMTGRNTINFKVGEDGIIHGGEFAGKNVTEVFGKELGEKIMTPGTNTIEEDGLKIGGEGMKGFYDRMLPSFVQKYTKKWGAKVGEVTMPSLKQNNTMWSVDVTPQMTEEVMRGQPMFLRTEDGTVYGWAVNGKIFLTPEGMNPNTPAHEYTHLWAAMVEKNNPKLWSRIVEAMKESPIWNEVLLDEAYSDIHNNDSRMASEVLSRLSGEENYRRAMEQAEQEIKAADGIVEKAKKIALWGRIKQVLEDFWASVKGVFGLTDKMPWTEFVNMALGDLYAGVNPNAEGSPLEKAVYGGNSGYVGYSMSKRAARAREEGRFPKTDFKKEYGVSENAFNALVKAGMIDNSEWHHTSMYGNKTTFYGWDEPEYAEYYQTNKAVIDKLARENGEELSKMLDVVVDEIAEKRYQEFTKRQEERKREDELRKEYEEYLDTLPVPETYISEKGVKVITNGSRRSYRWEFYRPDGKKMNQAGKAVEELERYLATQQPTFEEWKAQKDDIRFRDGEGSITDEEVAVENDPVSKVLDKPRFTRKLRREFAERERKRMRKAVDDVASALNTPIEVLESTEGLTGRRATAKGWYEKSTGKIVVVLPNNRSVTDVMQTVLHEAVAHYGLRKLFGSGFDNFIDNIYNNVDAETRQKINLLASRNGWNLKVATEEYLASLAEDANFERVNPSLWRRIKSFFLDMLAEAGVRLDIELSDNELRYILWRSYQNLKYPGKYRTIVDEARDIAKQGELKVGNYAENGTAGVNVAEESDEEMGIVKENSVSLANNLKSKEDDIVRNEIQNPGRTQKIISGVRRAYDRAGRASHEANERVARSIRKANAEGQILAYNPLLRETLDLLRRQTDNEIYNDMLPAMERLRDRARNEQDRKDAESIIWLIKRFKNRNERGTIIRDLTGADLGEEIPLEKIDELFEMWNSDDKTAELYKRVRGFAEELAISFTFEELNDDDKGGGYTPSVNAIVFNAHMLYAPYVSQQRKASTIVHEIIHAVTCYAIAAKKNNIKLSPKLEKAAQTINDIYDNVVKGNPLLVHEEYNAKTDKMEPVADYGASSAYEMISELSNPEFVEKLKQIEYDGRSVWQRIWDAIKSIFVGKNETPSVYEQLSDAFDTIVENFDREAYERTKEDGYKFFNMISDIAEQEDDILFRSDEQLSAQQLYDKDTAGLAYNIKEGWVDRYSSLKAMMEAIKNETGKDIADYANIYYAMEHLSARNRAKMDVVMGQYVEPLMAMVNEFAKIGITQKELERYLNSKHGLERNREMAVADACKKVDENGKAVFDKDRFHTWETKRDAIYAQNMSWADTEAALDKLAKTFGVSLNKDYSGLTAIYKDREKGLSRRKAAYDAVVEFEKKAGAERIKNLWERVNDINNFSLDESFASGIMSKDTRDRLKGRYKYYVPLRGFNDKAVTEYEYLSSIDFPLQGINKAAHGRHSEATDIIPTMMNMMESAVVLGNKNRAKLALLHLAEQYPTKLLTVSNSWYSYNAVNDTWVPVAHPQLTPNMTPKQVADTVNQWEADMRDLEKQGKAKRFSSSLQIDKVGLERWKQDEHSVKVKRNGKEYVIWVNGNPKAAQAINGILGVQSQDTSKFFQWSERANRWRAKNITSRNPEFVLGNFARDIQQASKVSFIKYGFKYLKSFEANLWRHSIPKIHKLYYLYGKGKLNMNDPVHRMFNEFMQAGSETGFVTMMSIEDYQKKIDKLVSPTLLDKVGKPINVAVDAFGTATELANRGVENACRFAAFMTSRKMGHSLLESVNDAKEVSLNFDRKGSGAYGNMEARQMKMFLNPTIQGLAQQITLIKKYPERAIPVTMAEMAMGYFAGKAAIYLFNWVVSLFTGDDDEKYNYSYYNIPEFVRRNNLIIPTGRGVNDYIIIPLSHEQRVAYGVGEILGAFKSGHMDSKDVTVSLIAQAAQALPMNPFDAEAFIDPNRSVWENFLKTVSPDILVPGLEALFFNENFAGMRITNQSDFNKHLPEYKRALKNTPKYMVELSKIINEATGGTSGKKGWADSPYTNNPAVWDHLAKAYLGGMYSFPSKISKTILGYGFDDDDFREPENWPIIGKFYMDTSNYEQNPEERTRRDYEDAFYKFKDEYGAAAKELTTYKKEITSSDEEVAKEARENLKAFEESKRNGRFVGYFKQVEKVEKNLKEALDKAREFKDKELEDELEQRLILLKKEAVKYVETQDELYDMK